MKNNKTGLCQISKKTLPMEKLVHAASVRDQIKNLIIKDTATWDDNGFISIEELNKYRDKYLTSVIEQEKGDIEKIDREVLDSISKSDTITKNINDEIEEKLFFGQKLADKMASFVGSWTFITIFAVSLFFWVLVNTFILIAKPFDPYPFILLNLVLSCTAAIQAPLIMMSQNRQEAKDRLRAQNDYKVNLKAELEIRQLHEKVDHLLINQGKRLFEIQQVQIDLMEQILNKK